MIYENSVPQSNYKKSSFVLPTHSNSRPVFIIYNTSDHEGHRIIIDTDSYQYPHIVNTSKVSRIKDYNESNDRIEEIYQNADMVETKSSAPPTYQYI